MTATKQGTRSVALRLLAFALSCALVLLVVREEKRILDGAFVTAFRSGPAVPPVRRVKPVTPPWPTALVAAGDIVPPELAPDAAPVPVRRDAALARAFLLRAASAQELETRTALTDRAAEAMPHQSLPVND